MAKIVTLKDHKTNEDAYPQTRSEAVYMTDNTTLEQFKSSVATQFNNYPNVIVNGTVTNLPDNEDIRETESHTLQFADRNNVEGMGYKILRRNKSFKQQVDVNLGGTPNTIYEVRYDFDLDGGSVEIPAGCTIKFNGGKIQNGSLTCDNTIIDAGAYDQIFYGVILDGTVANKSLSVCNYGVKPGPDYASTNPTMLNNYVIPSAQNTYAEIVVPRANEAYYIDSPIAMNGYFDFICDGALYYTGSENSTALTIGTSGNRPRKRKFVIQISRPVLTYSGGNIPGSYGVKIININDSDIEIKQAESFACACAIVGDTTGCCYNRITLGMIGGNSYCGIYCNAINDGWVNENVFYDGHIHSYSNNPFKDINIGIWLDCQDTHYINNNLFIKPCLEGNHTGWRLTKAQCNTLLHARIESVAVPTVIDDRYSYGNLLLYGFSASSTGPTQRGDVQMAQLTNIGTSPIYEGKVPYIDYEYDAHDYHNSLPFYCATYNATNVAVHSTSPIRVIGLSLDVQNKKQISLLTDASCRFVVEILNDSYQPVAISDSAAIGGYIDEALSSGVYISNGTLYANSDADSFNITFKSTVKYAFVGFRPGPSHVQYRVWGNSAEAQSMIINNLPTNILYGVPTSTTNVKDGASYIYATNNKLVFYDQNSSTWRYADGTAIS